MTTIINLGQQIELPDVYDATELIIQWHVMAAQARFQNEMEMRVYDLETARLADVDDYQTYENRLASLDRHHKYWSVYDSRPIFFLDEFVGLVQEVKLLWVEINKPRTDYEQQLQRRIKTVFDKFNGQKLHLQEKNPGAVRDFIIGKLVKSRKVKEEDDNDGLGD